MSGFARGALIGTLCLGLSLLSAPTSVRAEMIGTEQMLTADARAADLATVQSFVARQAVASELQQYGVDALQAQQRIAALSDEELQSLAGKIREQPAGAGVIELVGVVFIILLILELVGVTHIFRHF